MRADLPGFGPVGLLGLLLLLPTASVARTLRVGAAEAFTQVRPALAAAAAGDTVRVGPGTYAEGNLVIRRRVVLIGDGWPVLDGRRRDELLTVQAAHGFCLRGFVLRNSGQGSLIDYAAVKVYASRDVVIAGNRVENCFFGIYFSGCLGGRAEGNVLTAAPGARTQNESGNGLHLWRCERMLLRNNTIRGHRDGIYFEFVTNGVARRNVSEGSRRYGLHFMFSDSCRYEDNTFRENQSGVAVMYSKHVRITGNTFIRNQGSAAYGLLLKEIVDSEVLHNRFIENSVALHLEGSSRNNVIDNDFLRNGWAVRILADAQRNRLSGNAFSGNVFDVGTNSRSNYSTFVGNWWDRYRGYDLDHNGRGDVAHAPVRLFALLVETSPAALVLTRSFLVDLLDVAERVLPVLTPETLRDDAPLMHAPRKMP